jgi:putative transposase
MDKKELQVIAKAAPKNIKTEADLNEFRQMLTKITLETALNAELDDQLGIDKHEQSASNNNRNGYTSKTLQTEGGLFELNTPRDSAGSFEPQLVKKHQRRFTSMDDKILFLFTLCAGHDHPRNRHHLQRNVQRPCVASLDLQGH